jgi:hypothetical protein
MEICYAMCIFGRIKETYMRFQVLTVASMKFRVLGDVAPSSLVDVDRRFSGAYCLHHLDDE